MNAVQLELMVGRRKAGVSVRPDSEWPGMWRVHQGDRVSDMVNLARAKEAAIGWATPKAGGFGDKVLRWHPTESAADSR
jgi:hypothetical protein